LNAGHLFLFCFKAVRSPLQLQTTKNSHPLVVTLRISLYPDTTLGERIKKWRLEQGFFQRDLAKMVGVNEMSGRECWSKQKEKLVGWGEK
jgi:hypothetical protein